MRLVARREGVLAGISCGAALWAACELAGRDEHQGSGQQHEDGRRGHVHGPAAGADAERSVLGHPVPAATKTAPNSSP